MRDHERAFVHTRGKVNGRRPHRPRDPACHDDRAGDRKSSEGARAAELATVLGVADAKEREARVSERLGDEPPYAEQREGGPQRHLEPGEASDRHQQRELEQAERQGRPAGLVGEQPVVELDVERDADGSHQGCQLDRPPAVQGRPEDAGDEDHRQEGREAGLEPALQRVGHALILRRNARAATFAPTIVSAAGKAHCAGAPARASVRVWSVTPGTVESGSSTIRPATVSSPSRSTRPARSASCW